jgi:hypothetical protein
MRIPRLSLVLLLAGVMTASAQPSAENPWTPPPLLEREDERRAAYQARINEVFDWRMSLFNPDDLKTLDMANMSMMLRRGVHLDAVNARVLEMMAEPGTGPFWMFPVTIVAYTGRDHLSSEARQAIRDMWRTTRQLRGDTENHWVMYYVSLYLISELYPDEPGETWYTGLSSAENLAEARAWITEWMDITTTIGQGEYNATHYIGEYAIPMIMLAAWAEDREIRQRSRMMLDWIFAELAAVTLDGVLRGPNSRTDDLSVLERWNGLSSFFSWMIFGNTPPTRHYGGWGNYFAALADNYDVPEVIYRIAVDRRGDILQRDRARTRRFWRFSDHLTPPIYKTQYVRRDYAVGSYQGGLSDPIQTHVWDVTWREDDPRGVHNTMFSLHPHSSGRVQQMFFCTFPEPMPEGVTFEGKPSYNQPDKLLGCSPYEQVFQDLDTVIALYDIKPGEDFPQINGFFSKDLRDKVEHPSGWIFARGGNAYLAYRPLAPYHWIDHRHYPSGWRRETELSGGKVLVSPHLKNGTIVQAASADEFESYEAFQAAVAALPLTYRLEPMPTVRHTTLRGRVVEFTYGQAPRVDGRFVEYGAWKLFEGPHLNAEVGGRRLVITHGDLERVLDFNTNEIIDRVRR